MSSLMSSSLTVLNTDRFLRTLVLSCAQDWMDTDVCTSDEILLCCLV